MKTRRLGNSDLDVTRVGVGSFAMGGEGWKASWGPQDDHASMAAIHAALDRGVNWIDTAAVYGLGHAETVVGKAIRGMSSRPLIATKCGRAGDATTLYGNLSAEYIRKDCENSLRRLGIDVIDLYQIHWPQPEAQIEEGWGTVAELVRAGRVRYAGVSNFSVAQMRRIQPIHPITSLQPPYSILAREVESEILPFCREQSIGVICYSPMAKGLLSGRFSAERVAQLPETDHRRRDPRFQSPRLERTLAMVEELRAVAAATGHSVAELAVAWTFHHPAVTAAIVGLRSPEQAEVVAAADWDLAPATAAAVSRILSRCEASA